MAHMTQDNTKLNKTTTNALPAENPLTVLSSSGILMDELASQKWSECVLLWLLHMESIADAEHDKIPSNRWPIAHSQLKRANAISHIALEIWTWIIWCDQYNQWTWLRNPTDQHGTRSKHIYTRIYTWMTCKKNPVSFFPRSLFEFPNVFLYHPKIVYCVGRRIRVCSPVTTIIHSKYK